MFSGKPRPIPSKRALRVLYQLAYISSGTAVGLATLCAEERRRRTAILQRIADNAKVLRQSPRYRHHAATAEGEYGQRNADESGEVLLMKRASKASTLPSEVERSYGTISGEKGKRKRKRKTEDVREKQSDGERQTTKPKNATELRSSQAYPSSTRSIRTNEAYNPILSREAAMPRNVEKAHEISRGTGRRSEQKIENAKTEQSAGERAQPETDMARKQITCFKSASPRDAAGKPPQTTSSTQEDRRSSDPEQAIVHRLITALEQELKQELQEGRRPSDVVTPIAQQADSLPKIAMQTKTQIEQTQSGHDLLADATELGDRKEIERLGKFKLEARSLSESDMKSLCQAASRLFKAAKLTNRNDLYRFYQSVFMDKNFDGMSLETRVSALLEFAVQLAQLRLKVPALILKIIYRAREADPQLVQRETNRHVASLLERRKDFSASLLISSLIEDVETLDSGDPLVQTMETICSVTLARHDDRFCRRLLSYMLDGKSRSTFVRLLNFVVIQIQETERLSKLVLPLNSAARNAETRLETLRSWAPDLSEKARVALTSACAARADMPWGIFEALCTSLPLELLRSLDRRVFGEHLHSLWSSTLNFVLVSMEFEKFKGHLNRPGMNSLSFDLEVTMVEICTRANKIDQGLEILSQISRAHCHSSRSLSAAATALARKGAWSKIYELLELLGRFGKHLEDREVSRNLNNVLRLYSVNKSVSETWSFVARLIDHVGFRPTRGTSKIMLCRLVTSRNLALIPKWIRFLKYRGYQFEMDSGFALELFWTYYLENRPTHSLVMWMCGELVRNVSSFSIKPWQDMVRESISYDLRKAPRRLRPQARLNFDRLLRSEHEIPKAIITKTISKWEFDALEMQSLNPRNPEQKVELDEHHSTALFSPVSFEHSRSSVAKEKMQSAENQARLKYTDETLSGYEPRRIMETVSLEDSAKHVENAATFTTHEAEKSMRTASLETIADDGSDALQNDDNDNDLQDLLHDWHTADFVPIKSSKSSANSQPENFNSDGNTAVVGQLPDPVPQEQSVVSMGDRRFSADALGAETNVSTTMEPYHREAKQPVIRRYFSRLSAPIPSHEVGDLNDPGDEDEFESFVNPRSHWHRLQDVEGEIKSALSLKQYESVLSLYHSSLDSSGLPLSMMVLKVAVEASLRLFKSDTTHAEEMMKKAHDAGMNVLGPMDVIMLHRLRSLPPAEKDLDRISATIVEFYRVNELNGWSVDLHVALTGANILVNERRPAAALDLLNAIHKSGWAHERPFDIVALSIYLKAYTQLHLRHGVEWVVRTVLAEDIPIDHVFIKTMRDAHYEFGERGKYNRSILRKWREQVFQRREAQRRAVKDRGWELVNIIVKATQMQDLDCSVREQLETELFGQPAPHPLPHDMTPEELESFWSQGSHDRLVKHDAQRGDTPEKQWKIRTLEDIHSSAWRQRYKSFLERDLIIDGRLAAFRYYGEYTADELRSMEDDDWAPGEFEDLLAEAERDEVVDGTR